MFNLQNFTVLSLALCILSARGLLIYNEELLIACSFGVFVTAGRRYLGDTVANFWDARVAQAASALSQCALARRHHANEVLAACKQIHGASVQFSALRDTLVKHYIMTNRFGGRWRARGGSLFVHARLRPICTSVMVELALERTAAMISLRQRTTMICAFRQIRRSSRAAALRALRTRLTP